MINPTFFLIAFLISDFIHDIEKIVIEFGERISYFQKFSFNIKWCFIIPWFFKSYFNFLISNFVIVYIWRDFVMIQCILAYILFLQASLLARVQMWVKVFFETRIFLLWWFWLHVVIMIFPISKYCMASLIFFTIFSDISFSES